MPVGSQLHAPTRTTSRVAHLLKDGQPHTLGELVQALPDVSERSLRAHLATLADLGFVERHRSSRVVYLWCPMPHLRTTKATREWLTHFQMELQLDPDSCPDSAKWCAMLLEQFGNGKHA